MSPTNELTPRVPLFRRLSDFIRGVDETLHYDPVEALEERVRRLERQVTAQQNGHRDVRRGGKND